jgi:hypothetical protein
MEPRDLLASYKIRTMRRDMLHGRASRAAIVELAMSAESESGRVLAGDRAVPETRWQADR